jgi:integrase
LTRGLSVQADLVPLEDLIAEAQKVARESIPENTKRAYRADWNDFQKFCERRRLSSLPARPEHVCAYLAAKQRTLKRSTLRRRLTVIGIVHRMRGHQNPVDDSRVKQTWRGILRSKVEAEDRKAPLLLKDLKAISEALPPTLSGIRDKALLLLGFAGAFRRSELVGLNVSNVELTDDGLVVHIQKSKTDQLGVGRKVGIPYGENPLTCPVKTLVTWLDAAEISEGALFRKVNRHGELEGKRLCSASVALIVKRAFKGIGKRPQRFSGHSLRAGLATQAAMMGASERSIQNQTGHKSIKMVRTYIRDGNLFRENAAKKAGL